MYRFFLTWLFKEKVGINRYLASTLGFSVAVVNNFSLNYRWKFESKDDQVILYFSKFLAIALIGLLLNNLFIYLFNEKRAVTFYVSKAIAIICVFLWNFLINNFLNF
ncbi:MAG: GtrA family protein [Daejeonella sp.]